MSVTQSRQFSLDLCTCIQNPMIDGTGSWVVHLLSSNVRRNRQVISGLPSKAKLFHYVLMHLQRKHKPCLLLLCKCTNSGYCLIFLILAHIGQKSFKVIAMTQVIKWKQLHYLRSAYDLTAVYQRRDDTLAYIVYENETIDLVRQVRAH